MHPNFRLHVVPPQGDPFDHTLDSEEVIVGRATDASLPLADRFLSRHHARFFWRGDELLIEDLGSRNGTVVNGSRIEHPTAGARRRRGLDVRQHDHRPRARAEGGRRLALGAHLLPAGLGVPRQQVAGFERRAVDRAGAAPLRRSAAPAQRGAPGPRPARWSSTSCSELILDRAFAHLRPEEGAIYLRDHDGELVRAAERSARRHAAVLLAQPGRRGGRPVRRRPGPRRRQRRALRHGPEHAHLRGAQPGRRPPARRAEGARFAWA